MWAEEKFAMTLHIGAMPAVIAHPSTQTVVPQLFCVSVRNTQTISSHHSNPSHPPGTMSRIDFARKVVAASMQHVFA